MPDLEDITILQKKQQLVNFQSMFFLPQPLEWFSEHVFFTLSPLKVELILSSKRRDCLWDSLPINKERSER